MIMKNFFFFVFLILMASTVVSGQSIHQIEFNHSSATFVDAKGNVSLNTFEKGGNVLLNVQNGTLVYTEYGTEEWQAIYRDTMEIVSLSRYDDYILLSLEGDKRIIMYATHLIYSKYVGSVYVSETLTYKKP